VFSEFAIGGDLAAENGEERRRAAVELEHVVAGDGGGVVALVVIERADAGKIGEDVGGRKIAASIATLSGASP
jgi:hypothetical protein